MSDDTQVCDCNAVSKARIVDCVLRGASSLHSVCTQTRAGTGCGSCRPEVQRIIDLAMRSMDEPELLTPIAPREEPVNPDATRVTVDGPPASAKAASESRHANA
jgi:nitrite reductase (NADH) large subunit